MTTDLHKRIKEAAKKYADENYKVDYGAGTTPYTVGLDEGEHDGAEEGFLAGAEYGYKEALSNPWHKASEELPRKGGHYLCMDENKHIVQLAFCGTKWVNTSQFLNIDLDLVKYWMEIPELPKEE